MQERPADHTVAAAGAAVPRAGGALMVAARAVPSLDELGPPSCGADAEAAGRTRTTAPAAFAAGVGVAGADAAPKRG
jgi:hypothetical protein